MVRMQNLCAKFRIMNTSGSGGITIATQMPAIHFFEPLVTRTRRLSSKVKMAIRVMYMTTLVRVPALSEGLSFADQLLP